MEKVQCKLINKTDNAVVAATANPYFPGGALPAHLPFAHGDTLLTPTHILFLLVSSPLIDWLTQAALTRGSPSSDGACAV